MALTCHLRPPILSKGRGKGWAAQSVVLPPAFTISEPGPDHFQVGQSIASSPQTGITNGFHIRFARTVKAARSDCIPGGKSEPGFSCGGEFGAVTCHKRIAFARE